MTWEWEGSSEITNAFPTKILPVTNGSKDAVLADRTAAYLAAKTWTPAKPSIPRATYSRVVLRFGGIPHRSAKC
jgi:hypothetical protein